jgi:adenosylmethionine-8-amino-7-oxononanoate aminotransferase
MFACEHAGISPDFMCLSKGITAGYMPLSVVMFSDDIYNAFYCDYSEGKSFLDSHSYTGNTLACAVANASLDIFESDNIIENNLSKIELMRELCERFERLPNIKEVRQTGMIMAIELTGYDPSRRIGLEIFQQSIKQEVYIRPLGNVIYFMPPYIFSNEDIEKMINTVYEIVVKI